MNRIAEHREKAGIRQRDLVVELGWTQTRVSNYEAGRRNAGLSECRAIVRALNKLGAACSLDDVFPPDLGVTHKQLRKKAIRRSPSSSRHTPPQCRQVAV